MLQKKTAVKNAPTLNLGTRTLYSNKLLHGDATDHHQNHDVMRHGCHLHADKCIILQKYALWARGCASSSHELMKAEGTTREGKGRAAAAHGTGPAAHEAALISATQPRACCSIIYSDRQCCSAWLPFQLDRSSACSSILSGKKIAFLFIFLQCNLLQISMPQIWVQCRYGVYV
jgi:hypothetical protein